MQALSTAVLADAWHHDGPGWWIVFVLLFWAVVLGGLFMLVTRGPWRAARAGAHRETALDVLERRYARGEIDVDEYRERWTVLSEERDRRTD